MPPSPTGYPFTTQIAKTLTLTSIRHKPINLYRTKPYKIQPSTSSVHNSWDVLYFQVMMMSSNGNIFRITGPLWGESTSYQWIPLAKAVMQCFDAFFDLHPNKRLCKQSRCRWFEMTSCSLWCHCNAFHITNSNPAVPHGSRCWQKNICNP